MNRTELKKLIREEMTLHTNSRMSNPWSVGKIVEFKNGEEWKIVKQGSMLHPTEKLTDNEVLAAPYNELAKDNNISMAIPFTYDYLSDNQVNESINENTDQWNSEKYTEWIGSVAAEGGQDNAYDMAENANHEPGLIDYVTNHIKRTGGDESALERIQWDIEAYEEGSDNMFFDDEEDEEDSFDMDTDNNWDDEYEADENLKAAKKDIDDYASDDYTVEQAPDGTWGFNDEEHNIFGDEFETEADAYIAFAEKARALEYDTDMGGFDVNEIFKRRAGLIK